MESGGERASRALHPFSLGCILPRSCSLTTAVTLCTPSPAAGPPGQGASSSLGEQPVPALVPLALPNLPGCHGERTRARTLPDASPSPARAAEARGARWGLKH